MRLAFSIPLVCAAACAVISLEAVSGQVAPELSKQPLSSDQTAIYQDFLRSYDSSVLRNQRSQHPGTGVKWRVASYTSQLGPSEFTKVSSSLFWSCLKGLGPVAGEESIHMISKSVIPDDMDLVDPIAQNAKDRRRAASKQDLSLKADPVGYLSLSEIVFTPDHHLAVFRYSYLCGDTCGTSGVMVYEQEHGHWAESKSHRCGNVIH